MKFFPAVPGQADSAQGKSGNFGPKMLMMVILTMVIGGLMWNFFDQGKEKYDDVPPGIPVVPRPVTPEQAGKGEVFDPLGLGIGQEKSTLQPFLEKPEVLFAAAARDRTDGAESLGTIMEPAIVYLAHKIRSEIAAGKPPAEPLLSTMKNDRVFSILWEKPDLYRGKLVEFRGNVIRTEKGRRALEWVAVPAESNPLDTPRMFRSYVLDENKKIHLVYTLEDQVTQLAHMDKVILRGYFCRLFTGDNEKGKATIPILVASGYEKMEPAGAVSSGVETMKLGIFVVLGVGLISGLIVLLVNRRSDSTYQERRRAAREKGAPAIDRNKPAGKPWGGAPASGPSSEAGRTEASAEEETPD